MPFVLETAQFKRFSGLLDARLFFFVKTTTEAPGAVDRQLEFEMLHGMRPGSVSVLGRKPVTLQLNHPLLGQLTEMTLWQIRM